MNYHIQRISNLLTMKKLGKSRTMLRNTNSCSSTRVKKWRSFMDSNWLMLSQATIKSVFNLKAKRMWRAQITIKAGSLFSKKITPMTMKLQQYKKYLHKASNSTIHSEAKDWIPQNNSVTLTSSRIYLIAVLSFLMDLWSIAKSN